MSSSNFWSFLSIQLFHEKKKRLRERKNYPANILNFFFGQIEFKFKEKDKKKSEPRFRQLFRKQIFFENFFSFSDAFSGPPKLWEAETEADADADADADSTVSNLADVRTTFFVFVNSAQLCVCFCFFFAFFENCLKNHEETKTCWTSSFDLLTRIWYRCLEAATHPRETRSSTRETDNVGLQDRLVPLNKNLVKWSCHKYSYNSSESEKKNQRSPRWEPKWWLKTPPGLSGFL